jgi:anti-sigma-K factor RskA
VAVVGLGLWGASARHSASPAPTSVPVAGTTAQPLAHGQLTYGADAPDAVLTVDGLAPLETGPTSAPTYEVWLIKPSGQAEPAAYLSAGPKGSTWSAAFTGAISQYKAVAVTLEPSSGSLTPHGTEVMRADLSPGT